MHKDDKDDSLGGVKMFLVDLDTEEFSPWMMVLLRCWQCPTYSWLENIFTFTRWTGKFDCGQALDLLVPLLPAELVTFPVGSLSSPNLMLTVVCLALDEVDNYRWEMSSCGPGSVPTTGLQANCLHGCSLADVQPCLKLLSWALESPPCCPNQTTCSLKNMWLWQLVHQIALALSAFNTFSLSFHSVSWVVSYITIYQEFLVEKVAKDLTKHSYACGADQYIVSGIGII